MIVYLIINANIFNIVLSIDRLKNNFQPMQLQLLSNTLRNDTVDIENIIKSTVCYLKLTFFVLTFAFLTINESKE